MKTNNNHITEQELAKYLSQNVSTEEEQRIEKWLSIEENNKEFTEYKQEWEMLKERKPVHVNVDAAWNKMKERIEEAEGTKEATVPTRRLPLRSVLQIAAGILIIIALGIGFWATQNQDTDAYQASATEQNMLAQLPDNSRVYLNSKSELKVHRQFNKANRSVDLTGEAFFDVAHNPSKPFIIKAKQTNIEVLGTSFTVNTSLPNDQVKVSVKTGRVKFFHNDKQVILTAGETGIFHNGVFKEEMTDDKNFDAWHTRKLIFRDDSLDYVLQTIAKVYQVQVVKHSAATEKYQLTGTYSNESLDNIARALEATFPLSFKYNEENDQLVIE